MFSCTGLNADRQSGLPQVLPMRRRAEVCYANLKSRLQTVLPMAMQEAGLDMWLILCQEDDLDPVFATMIPEDIWCPILQVLVFFNRGEDEGVEGINVSGTDTHDLYNRPYRGQVEEEQWRLLTQIVLERDPKRIGINIGAIQWAGGGLTHNLYCQLTRTLPPQYVARLESAEGLATRWIATLTDSEIEAYEHVVNIAHCLIAECYSRKAIVPGVTSIQDLEWYYWQRCADLGLQVSFKPSFFLIRSDLMKSRFGQEDRVIRSGDFVRCDLGIRYLRLNADHQQWAYVLRPGEQDAPSGARKLMSEANRLQDVFMSEFGLGRTGNELLQSILTKARNQEIPSPRVYSHSLGLFLHEPGPLIGLPWEQERCPGRGEVRLQYNNSFTMELSVDAPLPEWGGQQMRMALEEDVVFTEHGCRVMDNRQTGFYLI